MALPLHPTLAWPSPPLPIRPLGVLRPALASLLSAVALSAAPSPASAQAPACVTARSQCPVYGTQPQGTACHCPDNPGVPGWVTPIGVGVGMPPVYQAPVPQGPPALRNDDIDDDGDVLAGQRRHRRQAYSGNDE